MTKKSVRKAHRLSLFWQIMLCLFTFAVGIVAAMAVRKLTTPPQTELLPTQVTGGKKIERKWLLDPEQIPFDLERDATDIWEIKQTYFNFSPELRVRDVTECTNVILLRRSNPTCRWTG
jgi:hypothetical protein